LKDKGSDEVVFKAMGRAINKTVMIAELIKVLLMVLVLANTTRDFILIVTVIL
jgi:DNA-binding protein